MIEKLEKKLEKIKYREKEHVGDYYGYPCSINLCGKTIKGCYIPHKDNSFYANFDYINTDINDWIYTVYKEYPIIHRDYAISFYLGKYMKVKFNLVKKFNFDIEVK